MQHEEHLKRRMQIKARPPAGIDDSRNEKGRSFVLISVTKILKGDSTDEEIERYKDNTCIDEKLKIHLRKPEETAGESGINTYEARSTQKEHLR
jgi:hypothetical protein